MASSFSLARSYAAAGTSAASARSQGVTAGKMPGMLAAGRWERRRLLERGLKSGKIKESDLGSNDRNLLTSGFGGLNLKVAGTNFKVKDGKLVKGDGGKTPWGFVANLGKDIGNTLRYLPQGAFTLGRAVGTDILVRPVQRIAGNPKRSALQKDVIDPVIESYKDTYGNGAGHFWNTFYKNPLGPILDAAAVVTGGGTAAAKAGGAIGKTATPGSTLARTGDRLTSITSREGRAPMIHPLDPEIKIEREYTPRVIPKMYQRSLDRFTKTGADENFLGKFIREHHQRSLARHREGTAKTALYAETAHELEPLKSMVDKLSTEEAVALTIAQKGVNTPAKIAAFQRGAKNTLDDPDKMLEMKNQFKVSEDYIRYQANLPREVKKLILTPNLAMVEAHRIWRAKVEELQELDGIDPERAAKHLDNERDKLRELADDDLTDPVNYPIDHVYVPAELASGFELRQPKPRGFKKLSSMYRGTDEAYFRRGPADNPRAIRGSRYDQSLFVPEKLRSDHASTGETFTSGAMRVDPRLYLDHVADRARVRSETAFNNQELGRIALRKPDGSGELGEWLTQSELDADLAKMNMEPGSAVLVNDAFPIAYYVKEQDMIKDMNNVIHKYADEKGLPLTSLNDDIHLEGVLNNIIEEDAKAFVKTHWGAMKRKSKAIPVEEFNYRAKLSEVGDTYKYGIGRLAARWMHRWRTLVLTYMPRWAFNTAAGSALINSIRGVNLKDYYVAQKLHKAGFLPDELATDTLKTALPTGANIGNQAAREIIEAAAPGYGERAVTMTARDMGIGFPTRKLAQGVQNIEDFFRRAQFIHNLQREIKLDRRTKGRDLDILGDEGKALIETGNMLQDFYNELLGPKNGGSIGKALQDPKLVERTLKETNKFAYNYSILGPFERRYVRMFIPFWGWYKFISMAAYRLPVEYPGRFALLNTLAAVAEETEQDLYGNLPDWLKGTIALSKPGDKDYKYLASFGLNPFSQVFNPLGPEGTVGGMISLGQFNPVIGAGLSAMGLDPMTGTQVAISPQTAGTDVFGNIRKDGQEKSPAQVASGRRFLMGLARSVPEFKLAERYILNPMQGYQASYPESVPFIAPRPMGPIKGEVGVGELLRQATGTGVKVYENYREKEKFNRKMGNFADKAQQTQIKRLKKRLESGR